MRGSRAGALVLAVVAVASCSSGTPTPIATVTTRTIAPYGSVLADGNGRILYLFAPDRARSVTCMQECAGTWPPLFSRQGVAAHATGGVRSGLLGVDRSPAGGWVVTYNGWPLYTYVADVAPGDVTGQALDLNGGYWYLLRPDGSPVLPARVKELPRG